MSDTKKTVASKTSDPRKGRSKTDQAKTVAETTMAKLAEQKPQDVSMAENVFNDMVTAKIRMHMDLKRAANVKIDEDRNVLILNPNAIPDKFDFTQEFRVTANDSDRKYMVISNGVIYMYKDEHDEPRAIGTASLEALPIVDTWVSEDEANTAPIYGITDKDGYEYRSSNFAGLMTLEIHGVDKDGNPAVKKQTRLVLKSARKSISKDRFRYTREVADLLAAIRTTPKALAFTIPSPKPLSGEAMLIDLGHLSGFRNPKSKFGVTIIPPAGIVVDGTTKTKTDGKVTIVRDVEVDDVQF